MLHSQLCAIGTSAIASMAPHRNTIEVMRLFATYHWAHSRFTVGDGTASTREGGKEKKRPGATAAAQHNKRPRVWGANRCPATGRTASARSSRSATIALPA